MPSFDPRRGEYIKLAVFLSMTGKKILVENIFTHLQHIKGYLIKALGYTDFHLTSVLQMFAEVFLLNNLYK